MSSVVTEAMALKRVNTKRVAQEPPKEPAEAPEQEPPKEAPKVDARAEALAKAREMARQRREQTVAVKAKETQLSEKERELRMKELEVREAELSRKERELLARLESLSEVSSPVIRAKLPEKRPLMLREARRDIDAAREEPTVENVKKMALWF